MKLSELQNGQIVRLRRGRAGREAVEWGPWESQEIYVRRRGNALKRGIVTFPAGYLLTLALINVSWAEYGQDDYCAPNEYHPYGVFTCESYYMEIEGLEA